VAGQSLSCEKSNFSSKNRINPFSYACLLRRGHVK
jgi:hypothetical protein